MNDPALDALAGALRGLAPRAGGLDRDALMFRAGRASAPRRWAWPLATAASAAAALALGVLMWARPEPAPRVVERVVYLPAESPPRAPDQPAPSPGDAGTGTGSWSSYLQMLPRVARWGFDGLPPLPESPPDRDAPPTPDALFRSL
jgi:hypothetical protein